MRVGRGEDGCQAGGRVRGTKRPAGFTLVEGLAVVALLSLLFALVAGRLAGPDDHQRLAAARALLRDLDARARLLARGGRPVTLLAGEKGHVVRLVEWPGGCLLARHRLEGGVTIRLRGAGARARRRPEPIVFDRCGRTRDYEVTLHGKGTSACWHIAGETGWTTRREER